MGLVEETTRIRESDAWLRIEHWPDQRKRRM